MGPWDKTDYSSGGSTGPESRGSIQILQVLEKTLGYPRQSLTIYQHGWRPSSSYSGSTHGGDSWDLSENNWTQKVKILRLLGAMAYHRTVADGNGTWSTAHIHGAPLGSTTISAAMAGQQHSYLTGGNGLYGNAPDRDWRPRFPLIHFMPDMTIGLWEAKNSARGYWQPGGDWRDARSLRPKGWKWASKNVATVYCNGQQWLVTPDFTFWRKSDFTQIG